MNSPIAYASRSLDAMVHASVVGEAECALRHRAFIASELGLGMAALALFPVWLVLGGPTGLSEALAFGLLAAPIGLALYLSRTGKLERAHLASAGLKTAIVLAIAAQSGWALSPVLLWLAIVPAEAALVGSRRVLWLATVFAAVGLVVAVGVPFLGAADPVWPAPVAVLFGLAALAYAAGIAFRAQAIERFAAERIRSGETRYRLLADGASDLITRHGANGEVDFVSPAARALIGVAPAELLGDGLLHRIHIADRPKVVAGISEAIRCQQPATIEFRIAKANPPGAPGRFLWVEMRCRPVPAGTGEAPFAVAVTRDISARREHEDSIEAARAAAEETSAAKSRFLAHISHELRTPLNAIIGFSEILERDRDDALGSERRLDYAHIIRESGVHLLDVVNTLLDMTRIEAGHFTILAEPFAVGPVVESCVALVGEQAKQRGIRLERAVAPDLPLLVADQRACRQILINLLGNAVKFTDRGGRVTVGARRRGSAIELFVEDTGIGIADCDLPHLGEPFRQAGSGYDRKFEGSGLGLSVVKGLAALHGGSLKVESRLGVGTRAAVLLPQGNANSGAGVVDIAHPAKPRERLRA